MASLPSIQELIEAVKLGPIEVSSKLHKLLTYGTDTSDGEELTGRTCETCNILVEAWKNCSDLEDDLVDALWLRSCTISPVTANKVKDSAASDALVKIIKTLVQVPDRKSFYMKLQNNLMPSVLEASGLAPEDDLLKRLRILNTQFNYKQQKYNLLQEESEGYSKLLHFLATPGTGDGTDDSIRLFQLIGTFELDPNRVMDLTLDILESTLFTQRVEKDIVTQKPDKCKDTLRLLEIIRKLSMEKLPSLLSFKMSAHGGISQAYLRTIAFLATEGILDFSIMFHEYCTPIEDEIEEAHKIFWMKEKRRVQALTRISLSGTTTEDPKITELNERLQKAVLPLSVNHVLNILLILLQWGEWDMIRPMMSPQSWEHLSNLLPEKFGFAFCDLAHQRLLPCYQTKIGIPGLSKPWHTKDEKAVLYQIRIDDLVEAVSEPLLLVVNTGCIAVRPVLYCQLCRLLQSLLEKDETEHVLTEKTYDFFKRFLVPSMSLFPSNPAISTELWLVLKHLPYATRYRLYEEWKGIGLERAGMGASPSSGKPLPIVQSEINAGKAARYALKRLSKDNIRDMSRQLAKVTHCCPLVVFGTILNQIESYDNMVEVMVEAQRFSNPLGLDVLGFCILSRLSGTSGGVNRSRLKEDGVNVSQWLQSLEAFSGSFFKRYPMVEFRGILTYLMRRLRTGHVMELGILGSLLKGAGGYSFVDYSPAASLSSTQIEGRAGSFTLKRETMSFGIVDEMNTDTTAIIKQVLQSDGYGVSMLILIAQARSRIIFQSSKGASKAVKLVGNLYDSCQVVISILLEFLTTEEPQENDTDSSTAIEEYAKRLPPLDDLHFKFGLDVESSWMLSRPLIRSVVQRKESEDVPNPTLVTTETFSFRKKYESMLPDDAWTHLSRPLFESFYTNSLYDMFCPEEVYSAELSRVGKEIERLERAKAGGSSGVQVGTNPPKNEVGELARLHKVMKFLTSDRDKQKQHVLDVQEELEAKKYDLMNSDNVSHQAARALLLHCVYPRALQTPDDSMYCAHFAFQLHRIETPGFGTLHYIDELISVVAGSLFGLTEAEAANLAILLWQTWARVNKWRYEDGLYESEVAGKPGSYMQHDDQGHRDATDAQEVSHKEFIGLYNSWHAALGTALIGCLQSPEYMHMRTGLVILTRIVEVFPTRPRLGNRLVNTLKPLQDENSDRPDIRASANAYCTMLLKARDDGKWIEEDAAVAQARADQEKAAARERKKKLQEQFEELQRDSEKITEEIGPRDDFERRRDQRVGFGGPRPSGPAVSDRSRGVPHTSRETGEVIPGDTRDAPDRRSPVRDVDRRRDREGERGSDRALAPAIISTRGGERQQPERVRRDGDRGIRAEDRSGARWARGDNAPPSESARSGRPPKRARGPSPEAGTEDRGSTKRVRLEPDNNFETRRDAGREPSPSRRVRPGLESSRPSRSRRTRR